MFTDNVVLMSSPGIIKRTGIISKVIIEANVSDVYNMDCEMIQHKGCLMIPLDPGPH